MPPSLLAQPPLFLLGVVCLVVSLRALPGLRQPGIQRRRRFIVLTTIAAINAAIAITCLGPLPALSQLSRELPLLLVVRTTPTLLFMAGVALLWIALRFDPAAGRPRCPRCWYDMTAATSSTCPECGHAIPSPHRLLRTRRSPRTALIALAALGASYAALKLPYVKAYGWGYTFPATPMIVFLPYLPEDALRYSDWSLAHRREGELLWGWQTRLLGWRARLDMAWSSDPQTLMRAIWFVDQEPPPRLSPRAMIRLADFIAVLRRDGPRLQEDSLPELFIAIQKTPCSPEVQREVFGHLWNAIRTDSPRVVAAASCFFPQMPLFADELAEEVDAWLRRRPEHPTIGLYLLASLAESSDAAWERYLPYFSSPDDRLRADAVSAAATADTRRVEVLPLVVSALDDANDRVVQCAVLTLERLADLNDFTDRVIRLARTRPGVLRFTILMHMARYEGRTRDAAFGYLADSLRADETAADLQTTLRAIAVLGIEAAPLLPDLQAFANRPQSQLVTSELAEAMKAITPNP